MRIPKDLPQVLLAPFPCPSTLGCLGEMLFISCLLPSFLLFPPGIGSSFPGMSLHMRDTTDTDLRLRQQSSVLCAWARRPTSAGLSLLYSVSPHSQRRLCPPHSLRSSLQLLALSGRVPATFRKWLPTPGGLRNVAGPVVAYTMGQGSAGN